MAFHVHLWNWRLHLGEILDPPLHWVPLTTSEKDAKETARCNRTLKKNILKGHKSFLWGHWYPCFGLLVMSAVSFKAKVDSLAYVLCHLRATDSLDSPLVRHLLLQGNLFFTLPDTKIDKNGSDKTLILIGFCSSVSTP